MKKLLLSLIMVALFAAPGWCVEKKITDLPLATSVQKTDVMEVVINPNTQPVSKRTPISNILQNANLTIDGTANEITSSAGSQDLSLPRTWTLSLPAAIDLSAKNLELPNGTSLITGDCDSAAEAGRIFVDTDATSGRQEYVCEGTAGWKRQGGVGTLTANKWCIADATGKEIVCDQDTPGAGPGGSVDAVGNCAGGDCFDGTSDGGTTLSFYDVDGIGVLSNGNLTAARTWTMPDATGTVALTTSTVSSAGTATALAANGANCTAGFAPLGVNASGAVESCFQVLTPASIDTSAEIAAIVTNETGTGSLVFNTAPTFSGTVTATAFVGNGSGLTGLASAFTTSAGLAGILTDEVGTGFSVFNDSPSFTTLITLPSAAAPVVDAIGEFAIDNNLWASGRGAPVFFDGTASNALVGVLTADAPTNGQVPTFNSSNGTVTWETPSSSGVTIGAGQIAYALANNSIGGTSGLTYDAPTGTVFATSFSSNPTANPMITFKDSNDAESLVDATLDFNLSDATTDSQDGDFTFKTMTAGALTTKMIIASTGLVTVGANTATSGLTILSADSETFKFISSEASSASGGASLLLYSDDGAALVSADRGGNVKFGGSYDSSHTLIEGARISGAATGTFSVSSAPMSLLFGTVPASSLSIVNRLTIGSDGQITFDPTNSRLVVPQGTGPTVDAAGQVAIDTTDAQLVYFSGSKRVISPTRTVCGVVESLAATDDNYAFYMANDPITVTGVGCNCRGTCTTPATFTLEDRSGNQMTITGTNPTCATTGAATFAAVTANNQLTAGEMAAFDVTNSPTTGDTYAICIEYTIDAQ